METKILVAKINHLLRVNMVKALTLNHSRTVVQAHNPENFIEVQKKEDFDLIIIDKSIFEKIGVEGMREIKKSSPKTKIMLITNNGRLCEEKKVEYQKVVDIIIKRQNMPTKLEEKIKQVLKKK